MTPRVAAPHAEAPILTAEAEVHERHFGNIEFVSAHLNRIIDLSQMRPASAMKLDTLQESIDGDDLYHPLSIARPDRDELDAYITFTNKVWGTSTKVEDFDDVADEEDGKYNLIVDGHRRLYSIRNIAEKHEIATGQATDYTVLCTVMPDASVGAIVSKQASANLHRPVPQEREAMAVVELYQWGLGEQWADPASFYAANKDIVSRKLLREAMIFANLSREIQATVFNRDIPYMAGVALGNISPILYDLYKCESGMERDEEVEPQVQVRLQAAVEMKLGAMTAHIKRGKFNSTAATKYIEGAARVFLAEIKNHWGDIPEDTLYDQKSLFVPRMVSAEEQAEAILRREQQVRDKMLLEHAQQPFADNAQFSIVLTAGDLVISNVLTDIEASNAEIRHYLLSRMGAVTVKNAA